MLPNIKTKPTPIAETPPVLLRGQSLAVENAIQERSYHEFAQADSIFDGGRALY